MTKARQAQSKKPSPKNKNGQDNDKSKSKADDPPLIPTLPFVGAEVQEVGASWLQTLVEKVFASQSFSTVIAVGLTLVGCCSGLRSSGMGVIAASASLLLLFWTSEYLGVKR